MTEKINKKLHRLYGEKVSQVQESLAYQTGELPCLADEPTNISYISLQNEANQIRRETHQAGSTLL